MARSSPALTGTSSSGSSVCAAKSFRRFSTSSRMSWVAWASVSSISMLLPDRVLGVGLEFLAELGEVSRAVGVEEFLVVAPVAEFQILQYVVVHEDVGGVEVYDPAVGVDYLVHSVVSFWRCACRHRVSASSRTWRTASGLFGHQTQETPPPMCCGSSSGIIVPGVSLGGFVGNGGLRHRVPLTDLEDLRHRAEGAGCFVLSVGVGGDHQNLRTRVVRIASRPDMNVQDFAGASDLFKLVVTALASWGAVIRNHAWTLDCDASHFCLRPPVFLPWNRPYPIRITTVNKKNAIR